jgi:hypothetical protein
VNCVLDDSLLDDPARLNDVDSNAMLRAAATAGAQVRATAEAAAEAGVNELRGERPRALVLVTRPGVGLGVVHILAALLGPSCPVPVVVTDAVPSWVGPLDVVLAHTGDPGDAPLAESIDRAAHRGARILLTAPESGPVASAAAGHAWLLPPRVDVPPGLDFGRAYAAGLVLVSSLGLLPTKVAAVADELDREAERNHPVYESFVNPAKALALRLADRTPLLWGLDPVATAVAGHAGFALAAFGGVVADVAGYPHALSRSALHREAVSATTGADIFADPDQGDTEGLRVLLIAVRSGPVADALKQAASDTLPGADLVVPAEEVGGDEALRAAVLAVRFDMAALYLGLAAGMLGGQSWPGPTPT